jgi:hypothetical protein
MSYHRHNSNPYGGGGRKHSSPPVSASLAQARDELAEYRRLNPSDWSVSGGPVAYALPPPSPATLEKARAQHAQHLADLRAAEHFMRARHRPHTAGGVFGRIAAEHPQPDPRADATSWADVDSKMHCAARLMAESAWMHRNGARGSNVEHAAHAAYEDYAKAVRRARSNDPRAGHSGMDPLYVHRNTPPEHRDDMWHAVDRVLRRPSSGMPYC